MSKEKEIKLGPTQFRFVESNSIISALIGPQGEGKTFAGFVGVLYHRQRQSPNMKVMYGAVIRDTFENIKRMTVHSIRDAIDTLEIQSEWHEGGKKLLLPGIELDLFGIDSIGSLSKIQGAEYSLIWLEEPAPILDKANAGLPKEVFDVSLTRVARQRGAVPRLQVTMNPADEDHWTYNAFVEDPISTEIGGVFIKTETLFIPYGENKYISNVQRELVKVGYKDNPELYSRYVEGKFSFVTIGKRVTPNYDEDIHRSKIKLDPIEMPNPLFIRMWDGGHNATCVTTQLMPSGRLFVLDTIRGENMGVKQMINDLYLPVLNRRYHKWLDKMECWRDIGDPAMSVREQSDIDMSASKIIEEMLGGFFESGNDKWTPRRESLSELFNRMVGGEPMVLISQHEGILHRALRGGWHYKTDNNGRIIGEKPFKDIYSHPGDAFSYGINKLLPWKPRYVPSENKEKNKRMAKGYACGRRR